MRHKNLKNKVGNKSGSNLSMCRNLAASLIINEKISTTSKKAKMTIPFIEKLITLSKEKSLHHKRRINALLNHKEAEKKLINDIGKKYKDRNGGYVRDYKIGYRKGDNASMVRLELV